MNLGEIRDSDHRSALVISGQSIDAVHDAAEVAARTHHPYDDFERYLHHARGTVSQLPLRIRTALTELTQDRVADGAVLIRGMTLRGSVPPTPDRAIAAPAMKFWPSEYLMCVLAAALGEPIGYAEERGGQIFQDVFPTRENSAALSSQSSAADLGHHTEMAFHPYPPDFLLLVTLRADPDGIAQTRFAACRHFLADLDAEVLKDLSQPAYRLALHRLHSPYLAAGKPVRELPEGPWVSILYGDPNDPFLRYEPELMQPRNRQAAQALEALTAAIERRTRQVALAAGDVLILDNRRAVHARSRFRAYYDGRDRWLRRMHIVRALPVGESRILTTDLATVAYP
jgi:alpha-ketoglutarate-dependent taurine dioxygenase